MGATEDKGVSAHARGGSGAGEFAEVDSDDGIGDVVVDPAFFDKRDEQWTGFLVGAEVVRGACSPVGVALHGGVGADDEDVASFGGGARGGGAGLDYSKDWYRNRILDCVEGQG